MQGRGESVQNHHSVRLPQIIIAATRYCVLCSGGRGNGAVHAVCIMQRRASGRGNTYGRGRNGQTIRRETSTPHRDWLGRQLLFGLLIFLCSGTRYLSMIPKSYCTLCSRIPDETLFREIGRIIKTVPVFYTECRRILLYMCRGYELRYIFRPIRSLQCCRLRYRAFPLQHLDLCGFCFLPFYIEP